MTMPQSLWADKSVVCTTPDSPAHAAAHTMIIQGIGALAVVDNGELVGILSERDLMANMVTPADDPAATKTSDVMTRNVLTVTAKDSVEHALHVMKENHIRHLPLVNDEGKPLAMLSFRDVFAQRLIDMQNENSALAALAMIDGCGG